MNSSSAEVIFFIESSESQIDNHDAGESLRILKPNGTIVVLTIHEDNVTVTEQNVTSALKLNGFQILNEKCTSLKQGSSSLITQSAMSISQTVAKKPTFDVGSSVTLSFAKKNVWKLDSNIDDDLIDEDTLLDEEDIKKPDASSLKGK